MAGTRISRLVALVGLTALVAACEDGSPFAGFGGPDAPAEAGEVAAEVEMVERDVEAPELFSASEAGLWDGRPSLGGIWVAYPEVDAPERVRIRNTATGREIVGALFRREREMPGPRIQVSSDAAAALGMVAGAPAELVVVALKRERVPVAPPPAEPGVLTPGAIEATPLDVAGTAAAAIAAAERTARPAAAQATRPANRPTAAARPQERPAAQAPAPEPAAAPAPPPAPAAAPSPRPAAAARLPGGSFVQVGIFAESDIAEAAEATLRGAGITPALREETSDGRTFFRLVVGPVATAADRGALIERVRDLGFTDAYAINN